MDENDVIEIQDLGSEIVKKNKKNDTPPLKRTFRGRVCYNTILDPHSFLDCKHLSIEVTHKIILGETALCTLCETLPSGLPGGAIVLEGFVGSLFRSEPGSTQEEVQGRSKPTMSLASPY
jgi:hypothetical protein